VYCLDGKQYVEVKTATLARLLDEMMVKSIRA